MIMGWELISEGCSVSAVKSMNRIIGNPPYRAQNCGDASVSNMNILFIIEKRFEPISSYSAVMRSKKHDSGETA